MLGATLMILRLSRCVRIVIADHAPEGLLKPDS